jgi:hypothetical protein
VPAARGTEPSEGPVTSSFAPRVPLAMPNGDADMSALADMSAAHPVDRSDAGFCIRDRTVVRLRPKRRAVPCARRAPVALVLSSEGDDRATSGMERSISFREILS